MQQPTTLHINPTHATRNPAWAGSWTHDIGARIETCDRRDHDGRLLPGGVRATVVGHAFGRIQLLWDATLRCSDFDSTVYAGLIENRQMGPI